MNHHPKDTFIKPTSYSTETASFEDLERFDIDGEMPLDAGIRRYVLILRSQGIETFESCEGGRGHAYPEPTIRFHGNASEGFKAVAAAMTFGLPVLSVRRTYDVNDGWLEGPWWEMTFRTTEPPTLD